MAYLVDEANAKRHREQQSLRVEKRRQRKERINAARLRDRARQSKAAAQHAQSYVDSAGAKVTVYPSKVYGADLKRAKTPAKQNGFATPPKYRRGLPAIEFYVTREWLELRYATIKRYGARCQCCNATGVRLHVDHIEPRSKNPSRELDSENLQVLCEACNIGKSNKDQTDWRHPGG